MSEAKSDTAREILDAAQNEFLRNGYEGARLQKIADQIGVTKAMIHYYFNTKKELFEHVYKQSLDDIFGDLEEILTRDIPLFKKIEQLVGGCLQKAANQPDVLTFVVTESSRKKEWLQPIFENQLDLNLGVFEQELQEAADNYQIASVKARDLLLNIFSLCYYPSLSASVSQALFRGDAELGQDGIPANRKGLVLDTILNWLTA